MANKTVHPKVLLNSNLGSITLLDVRTKMEHNEKHISLAHVNIPLDQLDPLSFFSKNNIDKSDVVYIICRTGNRANKALDKLKSAGATNSFVVEGGLEACEEFGLSLGGYLAEKNEKNGERIPLSLERQVRISAGLIVAIGSLLAILSHKFFALAALFTGCGLIFAGITNKCGLALVLTKAPWNKLPKSKS